MNKNNIVSAFEEQVQAHPDALALIHNQENLTYKSLNERVNRLAHYLISIGLQTNTPVALCLTRSIDLLVTMLAILKAGGGYLPIDATHPTERLSMILKNSQVTILITSTEHHSLFSEFTGQTVVIDTEDSLIGEHSSNNPGLSITSNQLAYVIYTSGSTGTPKCVVIEHGNVYNYCQWFAQYSGVTRHQRVDCSSNPIFDMSVTITVVPLMLGLTVVLCDDRIKKNPSDYLNFLQRAQINVIKLTPSYLKILIDALTNKRVTLPHLKSLVIGGENLTTVDCDAWLKTYPNTRLFNEYGPTETTVGASQFTVTRSNIHTLGINVPIGFPGLNMSCFILDKDNRLLPNGEVGELHIAGAGVARGYLNDVEQTQKKFIEGSTIASRLYKTGDLCRLNEAGILEFVGRIDHQVKIRGFRVDTSEIEKLLADHPAIASVAVVPQPDAWNQLRLVTYYISVEDYLELGFTHLRQYLQKYLPDYIIPSAFISVESFPLNANGKLDRTALTIPEFDISD